MKIIIDGVFNHVGIPFWAFEDVRKNGAHSPYADWFTIYSWDNPKTIEDEFDYDEVAKLTSTSLDLNHPSFQVKLELFEAVLGAPVPEDFKIVAFPLAKSWSEGSGRNVAQFSDVDAANFLTASYLSTAASLWNTSGSGARGFMGDSSVDYWISGTVGSSTIDFGSTQFFREGPGKLSLNVTKVVSASISNAVENQDIDKILEPMVSAEILAPKEYIGAIMTLCQKKRGIYKWECVIICVWIFLLFQAMDNIPVSQKYSHI